MGQLELALYMPGSLSYQLTVFYISKWSLLSTYTFPYFPCCDYNYTCKSQMLDLKQLTHNTIIPVFFNNRKITLQKISTLKSLPRLTYKYMNSDVMEFVFYPFIIHSKNGYILTHIISYFQRNYFRYNWN